MRKLTTLVIASLGLAALPACGQTKHPAQITFKGVDDQGQRVTAGTVRASTFFHGVPADGFGRDETETDVAKINDEGIAVVKRGSIRGDFRYGVYPVGRYYSGGGFPHTFSEVRLGRWDPWNPEVTVVVPRVLNPIPLHVRTVGDGPNLEMPTLGPVGFDLLLSDWAPVSEPRVAFVRNSLTLAPVGCVGFPRDVEVLERPGGLHSSLSHVLR